MADETNPVALSEAEILEEYRKVCGSVEYFKEHYLGIFDEPNPNQLKLDLDNGQDQGNSKV